MTAKATYTSQDLLVEFRGDVETTDIGGERYIRADYVTNVKVTEVALLDAPADFAELPEKWRKAIMELQHHVYFEKE